jgi:hypothetical protein
MGTATMFSKTARSKVGLNAKKPELDDLKKLFNEIKEEG